jgi:pimeloyl-ACP methyl ester carboxylesterase
MSPSGVLALDILAGVHPTPTARLRLADGRSLDVWYDDAPEAAGLVPLIFHAGTPGSGLDFDRFTAAARRRGLRLVSWSRPGYGSSTRQPGRRVADVAADTAAVLDHLAADRAFVLGHSGGGPHALACAALLADRVLGTALIAGVAPWGAEGLDWLEGMGAENHEEFGAALRSDPELEAFLGPFRDQILGITGPEVAAMFRDLVDDVDRAALTGEYAQFVADQMREGQRESFAGWFDDDKAFVRPWGFDLDTIPGIVHVWQGAHDRMVPFAHGRWLAEHLGNACPHLHPEHGHMSLAVAGFPAIVDSLVDAT